MAEMILKILKIATALLLQIASFSLLLWGLSLKPHFSVLHIIYMLGITIVVYYLVTYSLILFKQCTHKHNTTNNTINHDIK